MGRRRTLADKVADGEQRPQFSRYRRKKFVRDVWQDGRELDVVADTILGPERDRYRRAGFGFAWSVDDVQDEAALRFIRSICQGRRRLDVERALNVSGIVLVRVDRRGQPR